MYLKVYISSFMTKTQFFSSTSQYFPRNLKQTSFPYVPHTYFRFKVVENVSKISKEYYSFFFILSQCKQKFRYFLFMVVPCYALSSKVEEILQYTRSFAKTHKRFGYNRGNKRRLFLYRYNIHLTL